MNKQSEQYDAVVARLDDLLGVGRSFDMIARDLAVGRQKARLWFVDGYGDDAVIERVISHLLSCAKERDMTSTDDFVRRCVTFGEVTTEEDVERMVTAVLLGKTLIVVQGLTGGVLIDAKHYPSRTVEEPSAGKVLRGAHDGFIETLTANAALLRRRIRDPRLTLEGHKISQKSKADVVICYLEGEADPNLLEEIRTKLKGIEARSVTMSQESIAESLMTQTAWNPLPRVRYTERPDTAAATVMEGGVLLMIDNTPAVMLLPTRFLDFVQEANDYYFPPLIGGYLRLLRCVVFFLTLFITPLWYLLVREGGTDIPWLTFLNITETYEVPLLAQLLLAEFIVDLLKLASLNTPSVFSNSFSMLGALVLGDFAVKAHWLVPEVLAYMAFVAIANFAQPSYELGYAFKLMRLILLALVGIFGPVGFAVGCVAIVLAIVFTKPIFGKHYLYPLIPFNAKDLKNVLFRHKINKDNT